MAAASVIETAQHIDVSIGTVTGVTIVFSTMGKTSVIKVRR